MTLCTVLSSVCCVSLHLFLGATSSTRAAQGMLSTMPLYLPLIFLRQLSIPAVTNPARYRFLSNSLSGQIIISAFNNVRV